MTVKLLVVYHKQAELVKNEVFIPIAAGLTAGNPAYKFLSENMINDGTGENIAEKNAIYNELTAIYWAWKNYDSLGNPDYIGLCHYRRHFVFEPNSAKAYYEIKKIDENFLDTIKFSQEKLTDILQQGDFIAPLPSKRGSVRENYKLAHNIDDLTAIEKIIADKYPDYVDAANEYLNGRKAYFHNMFIFDRATFFRYCEWMFNILQQFEQSQTKPTRRLYVSERLTGIFFTKLAEEGKKPVLLPTIYVAGSKTSLAQAVRQTKQNLKERKSSMLYALKPLIIFFIPNFIMRIKRQKQ